MDITYLGHSCFLLRHKGVRVVTDPFDKSVGIKQVKTEADIVTISHDHGDHSGLGMVTGEPMVIRGPGEYEIKGVSITGMQTFHDEEKGALRGKNTVYTIDIDEVRICHLGDLGHKLSEKQLEVLDGIDVLMVPVGGNTSIEPKTAMEVIRQISPSIAIPMHYRTKEHSQVWKKKVTLEDFLKISGMEAKKTEKLTVKKLDLPEEMELVVLKK